MQRYERFFWVKMKEVTVIYIISFLVTAFGTKMRKIWFNFLFPFPSKLQNLLQKRLGMIHPLAFLQRSSFSCWANLLMGSWIWTEQQRSSRCKKGGFMISPMYWKASISLRKNPRTTFSGCKCSLSFSIPAGWFHYHRAAVVFFSHLSF